MRRSVRRARGEDGVTLLEMMVVLIFIATLVAVAIPSFLTARGTAQDRRAMTQVRSGYSTAKLHYLEARRYTDEPSVLAGLEPAIDFAQGGPLGDAGRVFVQAVDAPAHAVFVSAKSESGRCWYVRQVPALGTVDYASGTCGDPGTQDYRASW